MKKEIFFIIAALLMTALSIPAFAEDISLPPEMLFEGKPIDPKCVHTAKNNSKGVHLKEGCPTFEREGFAGEKQTLVTTPRHVGYDFEYREGISGGFYYEYAGTTKEGIILHVYYSTGGSGHFSDLSVYTREGDSLRKLRRLAGGDRCDGGIKSASVQNGHLLYSYHVTPLGLYRTYTPNTSRRNDLGNGLTECGAVINTKDEKIESVELAERIAMPDCFKVSYTKQLAEKKILSDAEARDFIQKFSQACSQTQTDPHINENDGNKNEKQ